MKYIFLLLFCSLMVTSYEQTSTAIYAGKKAESQEEKKERYTTSDYVRIKNLIKGNFNLWLQKGEFEKTADYQNRISRNSSNAFDSICDETLTEAFEDEDFSSSLLKYNADTEKFGIEFHFSSVSFCDSIKIPIEDASKLKDDYADGIANGNVFLDNPSPVYVWSIDNKDWRFLDYNLVPRKITVLNAETNERYTFYFKHDNFKNISFSTAEFDLNSSNINTTFNLNEDYTRNFKAQDSPTINRTNMGKQASEDYDREFTSVQVEARFPGDWNKFLERNLNIQAPAENGAPAGRYVVTVSFLVSKDGSISEVQALNDPGYGCADEAIRVIKKGPKWTPAVQNGRNVTYRQKQNIEFSVTGK
jgi:hypothetical protein